MKLILAEDRLSGPAAMIIHVVQMQAIPGFAASLTWKPEAVQFTIRGPVLPSPAFKVELKTPSWHKLGDGPAGDSVQLLLATGVSHD